MAKPQVQYTPFTEPPIGSTEPVARLGWRPSYLDSVQLVTNPRDYRMRGGGHRANHDTQSHAVFAVEQWTTPRGGAFEGPDNPQQVISRWDFRGKGGGYRAAVIPSWSPEDLTQPSTEVIFVPGELPDSTKRLVLITAGIPTVFRVEVEEEAVAFINTEHPDVVTRLKLGTASLQAIFRTDVEEEAITFVSAEAPDGTTRPKLPTASLPSVFAVDAFERWSRLASTVYPDATRRASTFPPPAVFAVESLEQLARVLLASATFADRTYRWSLPTEQQRHVITGTSPEHWTAPPASWVGTAPSTTKRVTLATAEQLAFVTGTAPEEWDVPSLSWRPTYVDRVPTLRPQTRIEGLDLVLQELNIVVPERSWAGYQPERTRRLALASGQLPSTFRGEALEQFARILLASMQYPDTTRRSALGTAQVPYFARSYETAAQVLERYVAATYADTTFRRALATGTLPYLTRPEVTALDRYVAAVYADSTRQRRLAGASSIFGVGVTSLDRYVAAVYADSTLLRRPTGIPSVFRPEAVESYVRTLLASVLYPDTTRRDSLSPARMPFHAARPEAISDFGRTLLESMQYPDTTRRERLAIAQLPFTFRGQLIEQAARILMASMQYPDATRRLVLGTSRMPFLSKGEAPEQFARKLLASIWHPDATRRNRLATALVPYLARPEIGAPPGLATRVPAVYDDTTRRRSLHPAWFRNILDVVRIYTFPFPNTVIVATQTVDRPLNISGIEVTQRGTLAEPTAEAMTLNFNGALWAFNTLNSKVSRSTDGGVAWSEVGTLPGIFTSPITCVFNGKMWVIGFDVLSFTTAAYSSVDGVNWTAEGTLPLFAGLDGSVVVFNGAMWIVGGVIDGQKIYTSATGSVWTEVGLDVFPVALNGAGVVVHDGAVFVVGGSVSSVISAKVYRSTDMTTWAEVGTDALPVALEPRNAIVSYRGSIWILGGSDAGTPISGIGYLSTDGLTWLPVIQLPMPIGYAAAIVYDNNVLLLGGKDDAFMPLDIVYSLVGPMSGAAFDDLATELRRTTTTIELKRTTTFEG